MTIAEKIRSMTDEEMAEYICDTGSCDFCVYSGGSIDCRNKKCIDGILAFLRQEAQP